MKYLFIMSAVVILITPLLTMAAGGDTSVLGLLDELEEARRFVEANPDIKAKTNMTELNDTTKGLLEIDGYEKGLRFDDSQKLNERLGNLERVYKRVQKKAEPLETKTGLTLEEINQLEKLHERAANLRGEIEGLKEKKGLNSEKLSESEISKTIEERLRTKKYKGDKFSDAELKKQGRRWVEKIADLRADLRYQKEITTRIQKAQKPPKGQPRRGSGRKPPKGDGKIGPRLFNFIIFGGGTIKDIATGKFRKEHIYGFWDIKITQIKKELPVIKPMIEETENRIEELEFKLDNGIYFPEEKGFLEDELGQRRRQLFNLEARRLKLLNELEHLERIGEEKGFESSYDLLHPLSRKGAEAIKQAF